MAGARNLVEVNSDYLCSAYTDVLRNVHAAKSQYILQELNVKPKDPSEIKPVVSEYALRELQVQHEKEKNYSEDAPERPFLVGLPISAKQLRSQVDSLDNGVYIPQIIDGKLYFTSHGEDNTRTALSQMPSATVVVQQQQMHSSNLKNASFSYRQLIALLGSSTCDRLEREFAIQNALSEDELATLKTAVEELSSRHVSLLSENTSTANSHFSATSPSTYTANDLEPNLLSVRTAKDSSLSDVRTAKSSAGLASPARNLRSMGVYTATTPEPNLLSVRTAKDSSLSEVRTAKSSEGLASPARNLRSMGVYTATTPEPNLLSVRTAKDSSLSEVRTAKSSEGLASPARNLRSMGVYTATTPEPNLLSVRTAKDSSLDVRTARRASLVGSALNSAKSPGVYTATVPEPNLLSVRTAASSSTSSVVTANSLTAKLSAKSPGVYTATTPEPNLLSVYTATTTPKSRLGRSALSPALHTAVSSSETNLLSGSESADVKTCLEIADAPTSGVLTARDIDSQLTATAVIISEDRARNESYRDVEPIRGTSLSVSGH